VTSIFWNVPDPNYAPVEFTAQTVLDNDRDKKPGGWADPAEMTPALAFEISQRRSHALKVGGTVKMVDGMPRNPIGRTGLTGRGLLGKYGPNEAADALVTRFNKNGVLEMISVKRKDNGQWAIPGGMVMPDENPRFTAIRELFEEAIYKGESDSNDKLKAFLRTGRAAVYIGYVDDPRNTDIAWMEVSFLRPFDIISATNV
jgi:8-oxo-dGTP pyrophosphatase MutT (NUDIX family)